MTNGISAQDAITVAQWNLSPSGYVTIAPYGSTERADYYCTGTNDDVTFQHAIDDGWLTGRYNAVKVLNGNYYFGQDTQVDSRGNMRLFGETKPMYGTNVGINATHPQEARIHYTATTTSPFRLRNNTLVENLQFYDDRQDLSGSVIVNDPAVFLADQGSLTVWTERTWIRGCHFVNSARWLNATVANDIVVDDCSGYPLICGIYILWSGHGTYITNCHWLPSYTGEHVSADIQNYVAEYGIGVKYSGLGGHFNHNNAWNFGNPIYISKYDWANLAGSFEICGNMIDLCRVGIIVDGGLTSTITGNFIFAAQGVWSGGVHSAIYPDTSYAIKISNSVTIGMSGNAVSASSDCYYVDNSTGSINGGVCNGWAISTGGDHAAIAAGNSRIVVSGVHFKPYTRTGERAVFMYNCDGSVLSALENEGTLGGHSVVLYYSNITANSIRLSSTYGEYLELSTITTTNLY
jgi:hypothetical protein